MTTRPTSQLVRTNCHHFVVLIVSRDYLQRLSPLTVIVTQPFHAMQIVGRLLACASRQLLIVVTSCYIPLYVAIIVALIISTEEFSVNLGLQIVFDIYNLVPGVMILFTPVLPKR